MDSLPIYLLFKITSELSICELFNFCQTNKNFLKLYQNNNYWKYRAMHVLRYDISELPDAIDKEWYMDHAGSLYTFKENKFEYVSSNIKKIFGQSLMAVIDSNDNLYIYTNEWNFVMKNVKQFEIVSFIKNDYGYETDYIFILDKNGQLFNSKIKNISPLLLLKIPSDGRKIDFISQRYLLSDGELYFLHTNSKVYKMKNPVGNIKSINAASKHVTYITNDNKLYFAYSGNNHLLIAENVKYNTFRCYDGENKTFFISWIDDKSDLYTVRCNYNKNNEIEVMEKQFKENTYLVMNNIKKIISSFVRTFVITTDHNLYEINGNFRKPKGYEFITENVKDAALGSDLLILILE